MAWTVRLLALVIPTAYAQQCTIPVYRVLGVLEDGYINTYTNATGTYYTGFTIDLLYAMAAYSNFTFTITLAATNAFSQGSTTSNASTGSNPCFGGALGALAAGQYDILAGNAQITPARLTELDYTIPLLRADQHWLYNTATGLNNTKPLALLNSVVNLLQTTNNVLLKSIYQQILAGQPTSTPTTPDQAVALVKTGQYKLLAPTPSIDQLACNSYYNQLSVDPTVLYRDYVALAVQKGSNILQKLNAAILYLLDNGTMDNLLAKWFPCSNFACS